VKKILNFSDINAFFTDKSADQTFINLSIPELVEHIITNKEGILSNSGAVMVRTGEFTGRSPGDKYIVDYGQAYDSEIEWGKVNQPLKPENFDQLLDKVLTYLQKKKIYIQDVVAGTDGKHKRRFRVISEYAWSALFSNNLFLQAEQNQYLDADFLVIQVPGYMADPLVDGVKTPTFVIIDFSKRIVLIGNTQYAGEIKKSVFTVMNRLLPSENVLPMHCSANIGQNGETALFFGLSGTGKTTLSSDPDRALIGDDEHGWSENGIFNFEGGCYAKTINLQQKYEPLIWNAVHSFASVLENVIYDQSSRVCDFTDDSITENTRGAYDLSRIDNYVQSGKGGHPKNIFFLSADAFGVLPPISLLDNEQVLHYFLAGYTAKLAGTELGLGSEPSATFSSCFGAPFLPLSSLRYAKMLQERITKYKSNVWLVNTGWIGGSYGIGQRIYLPYTRSMISAALNNQINLENVKKEAMFGLQVPVEIVGVPSEILDQKQLWKDQLAYQHTSEKLIKLFENCLARFK